MKKLILILLCLLITACAHIKKAPTSKQPEISKKRIPASVSDLYLRDCYQNSFQSEYTHWAASDALYTCRLFLKSENSYWYDGDIRYKDLALLAIKHNATQAPNDDPRLPIKVPTLTFPGNGIKLTPPPGNSSLGDDYLRYKVSMMKFLENYTAINQDQLINTIAKSLAVGNCPELDQYYYRDTWKAAQSLHGQRNRIEVLNNKIAFYAKEQRTGNTPRLVVVNDKDIPASILLRGPADYFTIEGIDEWKKIKYIVIGPYSTPIRCHEGA